MIRFIIKLVNLPVIMNVSMNPEDVDAMAKLMNITEGIVRQMFVRK